MRLLRQSRLRPSMAPFALLLALVTAPAQAQDQPANCRLHIWPSAGLSFVAQVAGEYLGTYGSRDLNDYGKSNFAANSKLPLNADEQIRLLRDAPLLPILGLKDFTFTPHDQSLTSAAMRAKAGRFAEDPADCYAELVISDTVLSHAYAQGDSLRMFVRFRQFETGNTPARAFGTWVDVKLPVKKETTRPELLVMLDNAFIEGLKTFGEFMNKPAKKR